MPNKCNPALLVNPFFGAGLIVLALNDHWLKWQYGNWLTGKLSDFAGLLILPFFIAFLFPILKLKASFIGGLAFVCWKLPLSQPFIDLYNLIAPIRLTRVVDLSDLLALLVLPLSHKLLLQIDQQDINASRAIKLGSQLFLLCTCFVFMATSPPLSYYIKPSGDVQIGKTYRIKNGKENMLQNLEKRGFKIVPDSSATKASQDRITYYLIKDVVLEKDTIQQIQIGFFRDLMILNSVTFKNKPQLSDWKKPKRYAKHYQRLIDSKIIEDAKLSPPKQP